MDANQRKMAAQRRRQANDRKRLPRVGGARIDWEPQTPDDGPEMYESPPSGGVSLGNNPPGVADRRFRIGS
jgi:hypothetical protein